VPQSCLPVSRRMLLMSGRGVAMSESAGSVTSLASELSQGGRATPTDRYLPTCPFSPSLLACACLPHHAGACSPTFALACARQRRQQPTSAAAQGKPLSGARRSRRGGRGIPKGSACDETGGSSACDETGGSSACDETGGSNVTPLQIFQERPRVSDGDHQQPSATGALLPPALDCVGARQVATASLHPQPRAWLLQQLAACYS